MTTEHHHHGHDTHTKEGSLGELFENAKGKALPFLDELLENPVEFMPNPAAVSDQEEDVVIESSDMKKNTFCKGMMGMGGHEMAHHGVGAMTVGGGMSGGMIMYMDGFRFAIAGNQPCLNLYFPSWTLDTRWKFLLALLFVFGLSFSTEAVSKFRHNLSKRPMGREYQDRRYRQMVISGLHGIQALLGYVVMLATMTFSVEILLSVVLGLSTGYYFYFAGEIGLEGHVTTNPCCNYMQDESNEHEQRQQQQQQKAAAAAAAESQAATTLESCCNEDAATTSLLAADATHV